MYSSFVGFLISGINSDDFVHYVINIKTTYLRLNRSPLLFGLIVIANRVTEPTGGEIYWADNGTMKAETDQNELAPFEFITHKIGLLPILWGRR